MPQNTAEAIKWFKKAAEQGLATAQYNLGACCYKGHGVPQNKAEAIIWLKKAAEQGNADAKSVLAKLSN